MKKTTLSATPVAPAQNKRRAPTLTLDQLNEDQLRKSARLRAAALYALATTPKGFESAYQIKKEGGVLNSSAANSKLLVEDGTDTTGQQLKRSDLRKLFSDDAISGAFETRQDACVSTGWRLNAAKVNNKDEVALATKFVEHVRAAYIRAQWSSVKYGYAVTDVPFEDVGIDGREFTRPSMAIEMPFEDFTITRDGKLARKGSGADQDKLVDPELVNAKIFFCVRQPTYLNPLGSPLLAKCYVPWVLRTHGWDMWAKALERAGIPFMWAKVKDPLQQLENGTTLLDLYTQLLDGANRGSALVTDQDGEIKSIDISFKPELFDQFAEKLEKRIQLVVLGQTLTSDVQGGGSYAAANVHDRVRIDKRDSDLALLQPSLQNLVNSIWVANEFKGPPPEFMFVTGVDLQLPRAERDDKLSNALARSGKRLTTEYFVQAYDLATTHIEDIPPDRSPTGSARQLASSLGALFAQQNLATATKTADSLEEAALESSPQPLPLNKVWAAVRGARDAEDLSARLLELLTPEELAGFAQHVINTYATARVAGVAGAARG
jgi:Protein of unknown function (DUF935)